MRWGAVAKGRKARHVVELTDLTGTPVPGGVALVPLMYGDDAGVAEKALLFAKARGVESPKPGDPLYERGMMLFTVLLTALDPDSHEDRPEAFFASEEEILKTIDPDRVAMLFYQQREWQRLTSPNAKDFDDPMEMVRVLQGCASDEVPERPFDALPWRARRTYLRVWANMLLTLPALKSLSGSGLLDALTSSASTSSGSETLAPSGSSSQPPQTPPAAAHDGSPTER